MPAFSNILLVTDFSDCSHAAQVYAVELARKLQSNIHLLHIVEPVDQFAKRYGNQASVYTDMMKQIRLGADADLKTIRDELQASGVSVTMVTREGKPWEEILRYAREHDVSLICISTHGRSGLQHLMLGSTTEKILRNAQCPVFVVRCDPGN